MAQIDFRTLHDTWVRVSIRVRVSFRADANVDLLLYILLSMEAMQSG